MIYRINDKEAYPPRFYRDTIAVRGRLLRWQFIRLWEAFLNALRPVPMDPDEIWAERMSQIRLARSPEYLTPLTHPELFDEDGNFIKN